MRIGGGRWITVAVLGAMGCQRSTLSGPSATDPVALVAGPSEPGTVAAQSLSIQVVDGLTDTPVAGATVRAVAGSAISTLSGLVDLALVPGTPLHVEAAGFLPRDTVHRASGAPEPRPGVISLWNTATTPLDYVSALAYGAGSYQGRLTRPIAGTYGLALGAELRSDPAIIAAFQAAVAEVARVTSGRIVFMLTEGPSTVTARVDPARSGPWALTYTRSTNWAVDGAEICFRDPAAARLAPAVAHELGHVMGLGHSPDPADLMAPCVQSTRDERFTPREGSVLAMMLRRLPGNTLLDADQAVSAGAPRRGRVAVSCAR